MPRTLITGIAGFTGRYVAEALLRQGHEVHGLIHRETDDGPEGAALHTADLNDRTRLAELLSQIRPNYVVHLAAIAFVADRNIERMYATNIVGTRNLLGALTESSSDLASILLASSANIYGNGLNGVLTEASLPAPVNDYGLSKVAMEFVAKLFVDRLPIVVTRPFNYTGVGQSTDFLIPKIVDHARGRASVLELGNLDIERDFSDVRTVADAYVRLLGKKSAVGGTFNVCSGRPVALRDVVERVRRLSGHSFEIRINPAFVRVDEVRTLSGSAARLEEIIGPLEHIPLDETLRWMLTAKV